MNVNVLFASMAIPLLLAAPCDGLADNGIEVIQFPYPEVHDFVECLGEGIEHDITVTLRTLTIERQNGGVHEVLNWFFEGVSIGLDSGLTWYTRHAPSPWVINASGAQSNQGWNVEIHWQPLDGGRPFREIWRFRIGTDANGVPRVDYDGGVQFHCVGR
jgi:hypothetical protein